MNKLRPVLIFSGVAIIGYALYKYYQKQIGFLKDVTYDIIGLRVKKVSLTEVSLDITTRVYNASNVEATVKEMYLDVFVNGIRVGNINEIKDILVLPQRSTDVSFNFAFNPTIIGKNIVDLATFTIGAKDVVIDVKGYIKVKSSFIQTVIPFEYNNNLKSLLNKK